MACGTRHRTPTNTTRQGRIRPAACSDRSCPCSDWGYLSVDACPQPLRRRAARVETLQHDPFLTEPRSSAASDREWTQRNTLPGDDRWRELHHLASRWLTAVQIDTNARQTREGRPELIGGPGTHLDLTSWHPLSLHRSHGDFRARDIGSVEDGLTNPLTTAFDDL